MTYPSNNSPVNLGKHEWKFWVSFAAVLSVIIIFAYIILQWTIAHPESNFVVVCTKTYTENLVVFSFNLRGSCLDLYNSLIERYDWDITINSAGIILQK